MAGSQSASTVDVSRRKVIAGTVGALAAGGTALTVGTRGARASVDVGGLDISDGTTEQPDGEVYSPVIDVDVAWAYEGCENAAEMIVAMFVGGSNVDRATLDTAANADSGTAALRCVVVNSDAYTSEDFHAPEGETVHEDVAVELRMEVFDGAGGTLANADARAVPTVSVVNNSVVSDASVGGDGSVSFVENETATK